MPGERAARHHAGPRRYTGIPVAACCPTMSDLLSRTHAIALDAADPLRRHVLYRRPR